MIKTNAYAAQTKTSPVTPFNFEICETYPMPTLSFQFECKAFEIFKLCEILYKYFSLLCFNFCHSIFSSTTFNYCWF